MVRQLVADVALLGLCAIAADFAILGVECGFAIRVKLGESVRDRAITR